MALGDIHWLPPPRFQLGCGLSGQSSLSPLLLPPLGSRRRHSAVAQLRLEALRLRVALRLLVVLQEERLQRGRQLPDQRSSREPLER